jgi:hypothetical protein
VLNLYQPLVDELTRLATDLNFNKNQRRVARDGLRQAFVEQFGLAHGAGSAGVRAWQGFSKTLGVPVYDTVDACAKEVGLPFGHLRFILKLAFTQALWKLSYKELVDLVTGRPLNAIEARNVRRPSNSIFPNQWTQPAIPGFLARAPTLTGTHEYTATRPPVFIASNQTDPFRIPPHRTSASTSVGPPSVGSALHVSKVRHLDFVFQGSPLSHEGVYRGLLPKNNA